MLTLPEQLEVPSEIMQLFNPSKIHCIMLGPVYMDIDTYHAHKTNGVGFYIQRTEAHAGSLVQHCYYMNDDNFCVYVVVTAATTGVITPLPALPILNTRERMGTYANATVEVKEPKVTKDKGKQK